MARDPYEGLTVETVINMIKQKHFSEVTAEDFAFLQARKEYLSDADIAIYLDGENPADVLVDASVPMTREERIINENRPLQDNEMRIRSARNEASRLEVLANTPLVGKARTDAQKAEAKARADKAASLEKEVAQNEKDAAENAKADAAKAKEDEKVAAKAQPVRIVR